MSILTGREIVRQRDLGNIVIEPFVPEHVGTNSYDLRLGDKLLVYSRFKGESEHATYLGKGIGKATGRVYQDPNYVPDGFLPLLYDTNPKNCDCLDMKKDNPTAEVIIPETGIVLYPDVLYLARTVEYTETRNLVPRLDGRSSIGRLGMGIHVTACYGDIGFRGCWTLELTVKHPLRVYAGERVCQISYQTVEGEITKYSGRYQDSKDIVASRFFQDVKHG